LILFYFRRSKDDAKQKTKDITNIRLQFDRNLEESNEYRRRLDLNTRDTIRLQDDLSALTRENQVRRFPIYLNIYIYHHFQTLRQELQHAIQDKENLKLQVQEYIKQVSNCENVIAQKVDSYIHPYLCKDLFQENDRTILFEQYRETSNELSRANMTLTDMETQANNLIQELQIKSNDIKRLTERIDYLERDLQQVEKSINEFCFK
jgi:chaperonin cofactor prefoldin